MKSFIIFLVIALSMYIIGNAYIYIRGWQALEIIGRYRIYYSIAFWFLTSLFIVTHVVQLGDAGYTWFNVLYKIGSFWVAFMLYSFLLLLLIDIFRIFGWAFSIKPAFIYQNYMVSKTVLLGIICLTLITIFSWGYVNAHRPRVTQIDISVAKKAGNLKNLRIAMVSDLHLGQVNGQKFLQRTVDAINAQKPDIVLIAGDTFDGAPGIVIKQDMGVEFERLQSRYGTYAVFGNHEYIGEQVNKLSLKLDSDYLSKHRVTPLLDSTVLVDNSFYIAGRKDRQDKQRKTVINLLQNTDNQLPIILMDHQPYHLDEAKAAGVDLQLSGHTHHGQMWPLNFITRKVYEQDWGFLKKSETHYYVSCGAGTWGPPIRTAGYSEIVLIQMNFE